jgi:uncharacterized membrane protein
MYKILPIYIYIYTIRGFMVNDNPHRYDNNIGHFFLINGTLRRLRLWYIYIYHHCLDQQ